MSLIRLFMLLNVGQQKVSARHLLEVVDAPLRSTFAAHLRSGGIPVPSEKEEKERPRTRRSTRRDAEDEPQPDPDSTGWNFALLLAGLTA